MSCLRSPLKPRSSPRLPTAFAALAALFVASAALAVETATNGIYTVHVAKIGEMAPGSWNALTGQRHDVGPDKEILYSVGGGTDTNSSSLRVYKGTNSATYSTTEGLPGSLGLTASVVSVGPSPLAPSGQGVRTIWKITSEHLRIVQDVIIVGGSVENSAVYHTVSIENFGTAPARAGWRNLYDWQLTGDDEHDGPSNQLETTCNRILQPATTTEFTHEPVTAQIVRVKAKSGPAPYQPLLGLTFDPGYRSDLPVTAPDAYVMAHWPTAKDTPFDYTPTGQNSDDTAGLSWFGRDAARARQIPAGGSVRFTQVVFATAPDGCVSPCLRTFDELDLCAADGTGDFLLTFTYKNLSAVPVHNLFLLNPRAVNAPNHAITFSPSSFSFAGNPVPPGGVRTVGQIRIHGGMSGDSITFLLSGLDELQDTCCAVEKTIVLPPCDCAQLLQEIRPSCRGFFRRPPTYNLSFTLQNLFPGPVQFVLLTPAPGSTPFIATPNSFNVATLPNQPDGVLVQNEAATFNTVLSGVAPGSRVCLRFGAHDPSFADCCSIERCFTVPSCNLVIDDIGPRGGANFELLEEGLQFYNLGPSGADGFGITFRDALGIDATWRPIDAATLPLGATLSKTIQGEVDGVPGRTIATEVTRKTNRGVELRTDFSSLGAASQTLELFRQGRLVSSLPAQSGSPTLVATGPNFDSGARFALFSGPPTDPASTPECAPDVPGCLVHTFTFSGPTNLGLADRPPFAGIDEVRVYPGERTSSAGRLDALEVRAANIPSILLTGASLRLDCNHNGSPDDEDLASRASSDANFDGRPDECETAAPADLRLNLNTGFGDSVGAVLPPGILPRGTADDDWRVASTGAPRPAKLVIGRVSAWPAPLPNSAWISVDPNRGNSIPGVQELRFERCFCLVEGATDVALDLRLFADDQATLTLNGTQIGGPGGQFRRPLPLEVHRSGQVGDGLFRAGRNCLTVQVRDFGVVTGLDLEGSLRATHGTCRRTADGGDR